MASFKNHIKQHIGGEIVVEIKHLESVTFDDICALIYLLSELIPNLHLLMMLR